MNKADKVVVFPYRTHFVCILIILQYSSFAEKYVLLFLKITIAQLYFFPFL